VHPAYDHFPAFDHYTRLGIVQSATPEEIRRAYRSLARLYHPDVAANKTQAEELFKRLGEAYRILSDKIERRNYDAHLLANRSAARARQTAPPAAASAPAPSPAPAPSAASKRKKKQAERPDLDVESDLEITFEDAVHGATYVLTLRQNDAASRRRSAARIDVHTCRVEIPAEVYEGQRLRLRGLGFTDAAADHAGDLYLTIRYAKHPRFRAMGATLVTELVLTPWEAALGGRKRIQTLDGMADLQVPPGTQPGQRLRLDGHGLPLPNGTRSELQIMVKLKVPTVISEKERQLWQAIASQHR